MSMTLADKEKCAEIFKIYTDGIETEPDRWNEEAGQLLAEMVFKIEKCSRGMAAARALWPANVKFGWKYLVKVIYHILKNESKLRQGYVSTRCLDMAVAGYYQTEIHMALMK